MLLRLCVASFVCALAGGSTTASAGSSMGEPATSAVMKKSTSKSRMATKFRLPRGRNKVEFVVPESQLRTDPAPRPSGNLEIFNIATRESAKVNIFNQDGSYNIAALEEVSHLLRCKRTGDKKDIAPRLLTKLGQIYDHFGGHRIEVVSGYRNQRRTSSHHFDGSATDIRITGVLPGKLRAFAETLDEGGMGIGIYPRSGFVHVDVRPPPSFRWIDWARNNPNSPDKRPPRGWKSKKLQS